MEILKRRAGGAAAWYSEENAALVADPSDSMFSSVSDNVLIAHICQRDERALGSLYDRYSTLVYTIAWHVTQNRAVAEEVVQDVFQAVWQTANGFQAEGSVKAWLLGIARHRAIDSTRVRNYQLHRAAVTLDEGHITSTIGRTDGIADGLAIREAVAALSANQRQVIALAYYVGLTHVEIASLLGEPVGTIKTRLRLGLSKLRTLLIGSAC